MFGAAATTTAPSLFGAAQPAAQASPFGAQPVRILHFLRIPAPYPMRV